MFKTVAFTKQNMRGGVLLLGGFDGLHVGHRQLLACAKTYGFPVGVMTIVGGKEGSLFTLTEREWIFKNAGVDFVFELPFETIKDLPAKRFVQMLEEQFAPAAFVCGEDFRFGFKAEGSAQTLKDITSVHVDVLPLLERNGEKISSSTVKALLAAGDIKQANELLGQPFFLKSMVVEGKKLGRTLGFPTANILYPTEKFPIPFGVYETRVDVGGVEYKGITNFGAQPTVGYGQVCVETYLDAFSGDLYGQTLAVAFLRKIREIQKFKSVDALKEQLQKDLNKIVGLI